MNRNKKTSFWLWVALFVSGCTAEHVPPRPSVAVGVLYATSRARTGTTEPATRFYGQRSGEREVGTAQVRVPHDPRMGPRETGEPLQRSMLESVSPRGTTGRDGQLDRQLDGRDVLVFVHGYDVSFAGAARRAAQLAYDLDFDGEVGFFAWPSSGIYGGDEVRVLRAAVLLREWLDELADRARTVHLIARGLGARAAVEALRALSQDQAPSHFGEVALVVPDLDADTFIQQTAAQIAPLADRITVYASSHDRALRYDLDAEALGDTENGIALSEHFETVDASAVHTSLFGHAFVGDRNSVVTDLAALFSGGPRDMRLEQRVGQAVYWTLEAPAYTDL